MGEGGRGRRGGGEVGERGMGGVVGGKGCFMLNGCSKRNNKCGRAHEEEG